MKIGDLAAATATQVETIRFYEREGLLPAPARTASNYRSYDCTHVERLSFIRKCRSLDMALDEVRALLRLKDAPREGCGEVNLLLDEHIAHVAQRIAELTALKHELVDLRTRCDGPNAGADCQILKELSEGPASAKRPENAKLHLGGTHGVSASRSTGRG
ncbi:MAG TPA: Cd(II)/Pb(II)-responsive transcriptional regulator [Burkholderiaceae bacterium]